MLSANVSVAARLPDAVGANFTLTPQVAFAAIVAPAHVSAVLAKSPEFVPPIVTVDTARLAVPTLVNVMVWGELGVFRG